MGAGQGAPAGAWQGRFGQGRFAQVDGADQGGAGAGQGASADGWQGGPGGFGRLAARFGRGPFAGRFGGGPIAPEGTGQDTPAAGGFGSGVFGGAAAGGAPGARFGMGRFGQGGFGGGGFGQGRMGGAGPGGEQSAQSDAQGGVAAETPSTAGAPQGETTTSAADHGARSLAPEGGWANWRADRDRQKTDRKPGKGGAE
jgi:hypothetical protein